MLMIMQNLGLPQWVATIAAPTVIMILGVGAIHQQVLSLVKAQDSTQAAVKELAAAVAKLAEASAVNAAQHDELSRRISEIQATLGRHDEQIARLRTVSHMNANKLQELDPSFRPYRPSAAVDEKDG